jgi:hypothetical protein
MRDEAMRGVSGIPLLDGKVHWHLYYEGNSGREEEGFQITFSVRYSSHLNDRDALKSLKNLLVRANVGWLIHSNPNWFFDVSKYREFLDKNNKSHVDGLKWLRGVVPVTPEVEHSVSSTGRPETKVRFRIFKEEYLLNHATKVFLSHKGADKPRVRQFFSVLKELGYDPWLDEDAMVAGTEIHRGILQGFKDSGAAVFFITPNFRDEAFLRSEVNHAVQQKTEKGARFAIITLVFKDEAGNKGSVPDLLHSYVWKEPFTDLEALTYIVRALPITLGLPSWRPGL